MEFNKKCLHFSFENSSTVRLNVLADAFVIFIGKILTFFVSVLMPMSVLGLTAAIIMCAGHGVYSSVSKVQEISTADELIAAMKKNDESVLSIAFKFKQELNVAYTDETQNMKGKAYFKKPDKIRIESKRPDKSLFVTDGERVWFYSYVHKQVMTGSWDDIELTAGNFFKGLMNLNDFSGTLSDRYRLTFDGREGKYYVLHVQPHDTEKQYFKMTLWIGTDDLIPHKTKLVVDTMQITTHISDIRTNKKMPDDLFSFTPPKDAQMMSFP